MITSFMGYDENQLLEMIDFWNLQHMEYMYVKKEHKMTREEAVEKVSLDILQPNGFIRAIEALGLIKFDEAKPIESETTKHFIDRVKWSSKDGGMSWFHKDYDPNSINPGWTKVDEHQELINEAEQYLNYEYSEFEKSLFYPWIIEVIKRLVEAVKSK